MNSITSIASFSSLLRLILVAIVQTNALWDEGFFPRNPRHLFFSGRGRNRVPVLREGIEQPFALNSEQWREYVLKGGAATQECFCIADCSTGDLELFVHGSSNYELDVSFDWDCDDVNALPEKAESCRIQAGIRFDCYAILYGSTEATDCGVSCSFLTPP